MSRLTGYLKKTSCAVLAVVLLAGSVSVVSAEESAFDQEIPISEEDASAEEDKSEETDISAEEEPSEPVHTEEEIAAAVDERNRSALELGYVPGEILVSYYDEVSDQAIEEAAADLEGAVSEVIENNEDSIAVVEISGETTVDKAIKEYEADPNVAHAQPNYILVNLDDGTDGSGAGFDYLAAINAVDWENWDASAHPLSPVAVGVIDGGFDLTSPLIQEKADIAASIKISGENSDTY